ncbi:MAG: lysophospholipid acyltransferase family protein [Deltaproteobacteria bacterium]|nr:MAG: lysophospholipid acyltransferase family protein [Deltaproteobacteria bacterium]
MSPLARRVITIPLYAVLLVAALVVLPLALPIAALVDLVRRSRFAASRALLFFVLYLGCEVAGIVTSALLWLAGRVPGVSQERYLDANFRLQCRWARTLLRGAARIFSLRLEVEGEASVLPGPVLLFIRHASVGDTVLPAVLLSDRHGLRLRYVLKRELLWDPCLDIVGNRLPNYFVDRESENSGEEVAAVSRLAADLGPTDGVLIYPEGTRFSEAKRARILEKMERSGAHALAERARGFRRVLPPKLGGPLALIEASPGVDVVFCVHVGFDAVTRFSEFLAGDLVGRSIRVSFWRVPAAEIPADREARVGWLFDQWERVDRWVAASQPPGPTASA